MTIYFHELLDRSQNAAGRYEAVEQVQLLWPRAQLSYSATPAIAGRIPRVHLISDRQGWVNEYFIRCGQWSWSETRRTISYSCRWAPNELSAQNVVLSRARAGLSFPVLEHVLIPSSRILLKWPRTSRHIYPLQTRKETEYDLPWHSRSDRNRSPVSQSIDS